MNKYVEEYIAKRKVEVENEKRLEIEKLSTRLQLGEKEFRKDFPNEDIENFPYYDAGSMSHYRYNAGEISDEEYAELLKYAPKNVASLNVTKKMSGWYVFAIIMMIIGCIGSIFVGVGTRSVMTGIASALGVIIFFSQIILLCKIEYNTRSNS